jgi:hypothetical protein
VPVFPFGGPAVPEYHLILKHFVVDLPMPVCCKKISITVAKGLYCQQKKVNVSVTNTTNRETLEVENPGFFHVRSLLCSHALLKIIKCKSLYLINHNKFPRNAKKINSLCTRQYTVWF